MSSDAQCRGRFRLRERLRRVERWRLAVIAGGIALALAIGALPPPEGVGREAVTALAITAFTVVLWATIAVPQPYAAIVFLVAVVATGTATPAAAASGFLSSTLWLVFGGVLIGTAAERSGFGRFIARRFLGSFRASYPQMVLGIIIGTTILSFFVPANMGRLAITVPIVLALAADAGYDRGSAGYTGLVLTAVVGNFTVALAILPANLLNIMVVGAGETLYGIRFSYIEYLWLCAPILGVAKAALVWLTVVRMFPAAAPRPSQADEADTLSPAARRIAAILAAAIALWATDMVHGLRPGWVAIGAGLLCLVPGVGVLAPREALDPKKILLVVWIGAVLSLATILTESGASALVSRILAELTGVEGRSALHGHLAIAYTTSALTGVATIGGAIPIAVATAGDVAAVTGLPLKAAVLSVTAGMSALFFPFVAAPLVVGLSLGHVRLADATRFTIVLSLLTMLIIVPLNAIWWRLAGFIP